MKEEIKQVQVALSERSYQITIGYQIVESCLAQLQQVISGNKVYLISDSTVYPLYGKYLKKLLQDWGFEPHVYVIPQGEESKSWEQAGLILEDMLAKNLERKSPVLALGGGVVGDLAGFVAALYRRGTPLIQLPTTLLAQVDSSGVGKYAVKSPRGKNMSAGAFFGVWRSTAGSNWPWSGTACPG